MITNDNLNKGAENLLLRCAELSSDESVVIIFEDQSLGWYNSDVVVTVSKFLKKLGINPTLLKVLGPTNSKNADVIDAVNTQRASLGAAISRLEHTVDNLENNAVNHSASRSRILDADYAAETTELARTQIIQQAGTAMLSQANQKAQAVLKLLQN